MTDDDSHESKPSTQETRISREELGEPDAADLHDELSTSNVSRAIRAHAIQAAVVAGLLFAVVCAAAIASGRIPTRAAYDQMHYHEPTIRLFASQFPTFDFYDYYSATTPGYHVVLAALSRVFGEQTAILQAGSAAIGAMLIGLLAYACAKRIGRVRADTFVEQSWVFGAALALPLGCSMYVFQSGAWLLPDNAGWLGVLVVCVLALGVVSRGGAGTGTAARARARRALLWIVFAGVLVAAVVFFRQSHAWVAGVVWLAGWLFGGQLGGHIGGQLGSQRAYEDDGSMSLRGALVALFGDVNKATGEPGVQDLARRVLCAGVCVAATVPAAIELKWFVDLWGGLTPYRFQFQHQGTSPAALGMMLALIGAYSLFLLPILVPSVVRVWRQGFWKGQWAFGVATAIALVASIVPATNYDIDAGRWTGLWNVMKVTPVVAGHTSVVLVVLAVIGAWAMVGWLKAWRTWAERLVIVAMVLGCTAAVAAGSELWPRYLEPLALVVVALSAASTLGNDGLAIRWRFPFTSMRKIWPRVQLAVVLGLTAAQALVTAVGTRHMQKLSDPAPAIRSAGDTNKVPLDVVVPPRGSVR